MSFLTILETLLIGPLKLVFEFIFVIANRVVNHPGLAIIALSLLMNILVLPLYRRADAMQEEARDVDAKLAPGVAHIKKVFSGDERMMILQTYYRQNHYKPTDALNGSVSLLLEVPFFMAAYQFLSHAGELNGTAFGPIADLGAPDGLIVIGGLAINALPILMTLINVISSAIYLKGFPLKTKIQLYGMALFFLVFLYTSPSGLVFYWTLNNLFSLVKTIFYKLKDAKKTGSILLSILGVAILAFGFFLYHPESMKRKLFVVGVGILVQIPLAVLLLKSKVSFRISRTEPRPNRKLFLLGCLFLTVLVGMLIPSAYISASPQEFVDRTYFYHPLLYILNATCLAAGTFLVWMQVFYWLANARGKAVFDKVVWVLCGTMLVNYMFFGTDLGVISANLQYETMLNFSTGEELMNLAVMAVCAAILYLMIRKWPRPAMTALLTASIALAGMSGLNMVTINNSVNDYIAGKGGNEELSPHFTLSKDGKNVVVIMLDRALGQTLPYIFNEKPELKEQFAGFTVYENTLSHGGATNFGVPGLMGGYEYTPVEMNRRSEEALVDKHNESLKVMPVLFDENGYNVTVCDPPYANYQWITDLSIYNDYPDINAYHTEGMFADTEEKAANALIRARNFFCFSIMKSMPVILQQTIYDGGNYNRALTADAVETNQIMHGTSIGEGLDLAFMDAYPVLQNLSTLSTLTDEEENTFLFLCNNATHEAMILQTPDYTVADYVDNTEYDAAHADRFTLDGVSISMDDPNQMAHYHINMAAFMQLGNWFDWLRENGVYDNTRIILVSDHGRGLKMHEELVLYASDFEDDMGSYHPILLVKDFGSTEFTTSDEFMTIADVPTLATQELIDTPINPFTGNPINSDEKTAHDQYVILSSEWNVDDNNGNTFLPSYWGCVKDDPRNMENWSFLLEDRVLKEHSFS